MKKSVCCRLVLLAICLLPAMALAQENTAGSGPVYSRGSASWYIGFGVGGGSGFFQLEGDKELKQEGGIAAMFKIGGVLSPHWLLGFEMSGWRYQVNGVAVQFNHFDALVTLFVFENLGLFVKGGIGLGNTIIDADEKIWGRSEGGFDTRLGVGYEFQLGRAFNLGAELDGSFTHYEGCRTGDMVFMLTCSWY